MRSVKAKPKYVNTAGIDFQIGKKCNKGSNKGTEKIDVGGFAKVGI